LSFANYRIVKCQVDLPYLGLVQPHCSQRIVTLDYHLSCLNGYLPAVVAFLAPFRALISGAAMVEDFPFRACPAPTRFRACP
jgi:hypothetical protein